MKIGYARVSSSTQDLALQKEALQKAGCTEIYSESLSGKDTQRPQLKLMLERIREGDIIMVYKMDRLSRSLKDLLTIIEMLDQKKVHLISLDSGDRVDTTSPMNKAFLQIGGVFAELERGMIRARTQEGIKRAKENGVKFGRTVGTQNQITLSKKEHIKIFLQAGKSYNWISKELSISKKTISNIKKTLASSEL